MNTPEKNPASSAQIKRFGTIKGKIWTQPKWARFRLFIQYYNGNAKYPSYDYTFKHVQGFKTKIKSEVTGLTKLMELMHKKTKGKVYRYANIFCTIGSDMSTVTGNFDYLVCTITPGDIKWKDPLYWKIDDSNMLDISRMRAHAELKRKEIESSCLTAVRQEQFQKALFQ